MTPPPQPEKPAATPSPIAAAMPEFARAVRGLAHVPKSEMGAAMAKEKAAKKSGGGK